MKLIPQYKCDWCEQSTADTHTAPISWLHLEQVVNSDNLHLDFCCARCLVAWLCRWALRERQAYKEDAPFGKVTVLLADDHSKIKTEVGIFTFNLKTITQE